MSANQIVVSINIEIMYVSSGTEERLDSSVSYFDGTYNYALLYQRKLLINQQFGSLSAVNDAVLP